MSKYVVKYVNRDKNLSRGLRNNNPGNIRCGSSRWLGLSSLQNDSEFCQFDSLMFGVRALLIVLRSYYNKYNCNTIRKVISRYAPSTENNTEKYIKFVCDYLCIPADYEFSLSSCLYVALPIMVYESGYRVHPDTFKAIIEKYHIL